MGVKWQGSLCTALALFLCSLPALAQTSATLSGRVTDSSGSVVPGAKVEATDTQTNVVYSAETNETGSYSLPSLLPGTYQVKVEKQGFEIVLKPGVVLHVADHISIDFTLQPGAVTQTVTVQGGAPIVDTTSSTLSSLVNEHEVEDLPLNGRSYAGLTLMQPGIVWDTDISEGTNSSSGIWFSANGAPLRSNNYMLDGAILQDLNNGTSSSLSGTTLGLDGISEYKVMTSGITADYGLEMGSQIVMVSKPGTNRFHGSVFEYLRNSYMDAANYFDVPTAATNFERLPEFRRNNFGASAGGPIRKDKTFYFVTFEGLKEHLGVTEDTIVPGAGCHGAANAVITAAACPQLSNVSSVTIAPAIAPILALFPLPNLPGNGLTYPAFQPNSEYFGQVRIDQNFGPSDTMFGRYTIDDDSQILPIAQPQFTNVRLSRHQYTTLGENHTFSSSLLNTMRLSYSRTAAHRNSGDLTSVTGPSYSYVAGDPIGQTIIGGLTTFGPAMSVVAYQSQNLFTYTDDVFYEHGNHSLKFGTMIDHYRQFGSNGGGLYGSVTFSSVANFLQAVSSKYSAVTPGSDLARTYTFWVLGFYAQDDWRVGRNFTLNLGLRYEPETQMTEPQGIQSELRNPAVDANYTPGLIFLDPSRHNVSPRLGFAWNVTGDGKTALRGGFSLMYDNGNLTNGILFLNPGQPPFSSTSTVGVSSTITSLPLSFAGATIGRSGEDTAQYHLQQPQLFAENLTLERQLPFDALLSLSYVGSEGVHLMDEQEINPNVPQIINGQPFWSASPAPINPNWGSILCMCTTQHSSYNALEANLVKQISKGLQFQTAFTWEKLMDDAQGQTTSDSTASSTFNTDPFNKRTDRGPASFNVPRSLVINGLYQFPDPSLNQRLLQTLAAGWAMSEIFTVHDGLPFNPSEVTERSRSGVDGGASGIDRPDWNPSFTGPVILGNPTRYFNPNAFILQPVGTLGNVGRNSLSGPGFEDFDFSMRKDTKIGFLGEAGNVELRGDFFNVLNHPNFSPPSTSVFSAALADTTETPLSTAGQITGTANASREIQVSLRLSW